MNEQHAALRSSKGVLTSVAGYDEPLQNAGSRSLHYQSAIGASKSRITSTSRYAEASVNRLRPELASSDHRGTASQPKKSRLSGIASATNSSVAGLATPETEGARFRLDKNAILRKRLHSEKIGKSAPSFVSTQADVELDDPQTTSPTRPFSCTPLVQNQNIVEKTPALDTQSSSMTQAPLESHSQDTHSATEDDESAETLSTDKGILPDDEESFPVITNPTIPSTHDSILGQDMCLPSPSLSPVTAMNTHNPDYFLDFRDDQGADTDSSMDNLLPAPSSVPRQKDYSNTSNSQSTLGHVSVQARPTSLMDIPATLNFFEAMPDEMKTYMVYQLLKRCPKPTLQFVADTVNPALKCDFLALLPPELTLNIIKYFDYQTMCRASQVSKKWRHIINSDERAWKELFERDGFTLSPGELQQAIREGWGWQFPNGRDDWEKNIAPSTLKNDSDYFNQTSESSSSLFVNSLDVDSGQSRRTKRKAIVKMSARKTRRKLLSSHRLESPTSDTSDWMNDASLLEGPAAAANAAANAVPYPDVGLSSLRSLHLYKSLYRRHLSIRKKLDAF